MGRVSIPYPTGESGLGSVVAPLTRSRAEPRPKKCIWSLLNLKYGLWLMLALNHYFWRNEKELRMSHVKWKRCYGTAIESHKHLRHSINSTCVFSRALGRVHSGIWEFQPGVQHFAHRRQLVDANTTVACPVWHGTCPHDAAQLRAARQHTSVSRLRHQTSWLEGQSRRRVRRSTHSRARFCILTRDAMLARYLLSSRVCLSVCLS